jgi:hypothetical protein
MLLNSAASKLALPCDSNTGDDYGGSVHPMGILWKKGDPH